jgi:hypothetical protein
MPMVATGALADAPYHRYKNPGSDSRLDINKTMITID